ncbi:AIPR family protein [Agromyces sp. C10]|uniref:AIPR family protein n=1 Tax=Agromyces sp. C10 TaxID=2935077 RepID=UPI00200B36BC|nr:AIPR family protein [Agromyces sp. C10]MCK8607906.1 AIPR family protein [Agromyces sp. C10]
MPSPLDDADDILFAGIAGEKVGSRTDSAALLAWYLVNVWRVDPEDVDSAICDGGGDKGIDALIVDDDLSEITIFQAKYRQDPSRTTQGDGDLKNLVGAAAWLESAEAVDRLMAAGPNQELRNLIARQQVRDKVASGVHVVRLIFVTNAELDAAGSSYAETRKDGPPPLEVWDRGKLTEIAERTQRPSLMDDARALRTASAPMVIDLTHQAKMAVCVVPASELVALPGIEDRALFSRNVRLFAGRTRINKELRRTVQNLDEHRLFPAYHNGLTLLTNQIGTVTEDSITLDGVGVVNGCQSLITLYDNRNALTDELQLIVKVVEVTGDDRIADLITYRSNNQNAVTLRDQRSSDTTMRDLQQGTADRFGSKFALVTRVGEVINATETLENTLAAQLIMAAYLKEPWAAVRKVRLFDQDYRRIFNRTITPDRLYLLHLIDKAVGAHREELRPDLRASYASIRFTLVYLVCVVVEISEAGARLMREPEAWLPEEEDAVLASLDAIAAEVVDSANYHVQAELQADPDYDPKVVFKSRGGVSRLETDVLRDARRQAGRAHSYLFTVTPADRS